MRRLEVTPPPCDEHRCLRHPRGQPRCGLIVAAGADEFLGLKMMASLVCPYSEGRNSDCVIVHSSALGSSTGVVVLGTD